MIIGIMANGPGAGKSTTAGLIATALLDHNLTTVVCPFAEPLKNICRAMGWNDDKDEKGRALLDTLGMGGRAYDVNCWVNLWKKNNEAALFDPAVVVLVDDVRFPNEVDMIKKLGGKIIFVERPGVERPDLDSEGYTLKDYDGHFYNKGNIANLNEKIKAWLEVYV